MKRKRESSSPPPAPSAPANLPDWANLPEAPLQCILDSLLKSNPDLLDFLSFSSVCKNWRAIPATTPAFPPLLLLPQIPMPGRSSHPESLRWSHPILLQTLNGRTFESRIKAENLDIGQTLRHPPLALEQLDFHGYSNGCLITFPCIMDDIFLPPPPLIHFSHIPILANVFTGEYTRLFLNLICIPKFSLAGQNILICIKRNGDISYYRFGTNYNPRYIRPHGERSVISAAFHQKKLFLLDANSMLGVLEHELYGFLDESVTFFDFWRLDAAQEHVVRGSRLFGCGEELMVLRFCEKLGDPPHRFFMTVYRLDSERSEWVQESLDNCCIFLDTVGHCPIACPDADRWGGRSNSVYFAWHPSSIVIPLDEEIDCGDRALRFLRHLFDTSNAAIDYGGPRPVWVSGSTPSKR